jgi:hypothetical protein
VIDTPTFIDRDIIKIWYGHYKAESENPVGVFIDFGDEPYEAGSIFLSKQELHELIDIIEEKETNGA